MLTPVGCIGGVQISKWATYVGGSGGSVGVSSTASASVGAAYVAAPLNSGSDEYHGPSLAIAVVVLPFGDLNSVGN